MMYADDKHESESGFNNIGEVEVTGVTEKRNFEGFYSLDSKQLYDEASLEMVLIKSELLKVAQACLKMLDTPIQVEVLIATVEGRALDENTIDVKCTPIRAYKSEYVTCGDIVYHIVGRDEFNQVVVEATDFESKTEWTFKVDLYLLRDLFGKVVGE